MTPYNVLDTIKSINNKAFSETIALLANSQPTFTAFEREVIAGKAYESLITTCRLNDLLSSSELSDLKERLT